MATGTRLGYDPGNYQVWGTPGGFSVHLSLKVVRELSAQIAVSGETRGILLGRSNSAPSAATMADDFVVIPSFEDFTSARRRAENDGRGLRAVGYFRSQHDDRLRLDAHDLQIFDRLLPGNGNLALLIRVPQRGHNEAALYYWQNGQAQPDEFGFAFPFDETKLAGGRPAARSPEPFQAEPAAPARSPFRPAPEAPASAPGEGIQWFRLLPTAAIVVMGIILTQMAWNARGTASAGPAPAAEAALPATEPVRETPLGLKVTLEPHQLEIRWNRAAPAITTATKGKMSMSEAGVTETVPFDAQELREGYVAYGPKTNDVRIRLEVTAQDGAATTESIRVVAIP